MPKIAEDNFNLHAIDVYQSPADREHLTVMVNSHRPPADRATAPVVGASSVVEIFETRIGSKELKWVKTVEHPLMRTPNNLVVMGERSFYFSNDHRRKAHWVCSSSDNLSRTELTRPSHSPASSSFSTPSRRI